MLSCLVAIPSFWQAKINDENLIAIVPVVTQHKVIWFDVSMQYVVLMHNFNYFHYLSTYFQDGLQIEPFATLLELGIKTDW